MTDGTNIDRLLSNGNPHLPETTPERASSLDLAKLQEIYGVTTVANWQTDAASAARQAEVREIGDTWADLRKRAPQDAQAATQLAELEAHHPDVKVMLSLAEARKSLSRATEPLRSTLSTIDATLKEEKGHATKLASLVEWESNIHKIPESQRHVVLARTIESIKREDSRGITMRQALARLIKDEWGVELTDEMSVADVLASIKRPDQEPVDYMDLLAVARNHHEKTKQRIAKLEQQRAAIDQDIRSQVATMNLSLLNQAYAAGHIRLSKYLADKMALSSHKVDLVNTISRNMPQVDGRFKHRHNAAKNVVYDVIQARLTDILLTTDPSMSPDELARYVSETIVKTTQLVARAALNPYTGAIKEAELLQLANDYLSAVIYPGYQIEFKVGLGGSEADPNCRLPAYLVAPLEHMRDFLKLGLRPPKLTVLNAWRISSRVNPINPDRAAQVAQRSTDILRRFVNEFYEELADYVSFEEVDEEYITSNPITRLGQTILESFMQIEHPETDVALRALQRLYTRGDKHGAQETNVDTRRRNTNLYAAGHVAVFGTAYPASMAKSIPDAVIKWGGAGEDSFNAIQRFLADKIRQHRDYSHIAILPNAGWPTDEAGVRRPRTQTNIPMRAGGDPPPYYTIGTEEISAGPVRFQTMEALIAHYQKATEQSGRYPRSVEDLEVLRKALGDRYIAFLNSLTSI